MPLLPTDSFADYALMWAIRQGGIPRRRAENTLFARHHAPLTRLGTRHYGLGPDETNTAFADAFLTTVQHIADGRFAGLSGLKTYLHRLFMNKCIDALRHRKTATGQLHYQTQSLDETTELSHCHLLSDTTSALDILIQQQDVAQMQQCLTSLPTRPRDLLLAWGAGDADNDVAQRLGYASAGVVRTMRLRALAQMRGMMRA
jgi:RNA polymerase sigma factor (sigma-70 family)